MEPATTCCLYDTLNPPHEDFKMTMQHKSTIL